MNHHQTRLTCQHFEPEMNGRMRDSTAGRASMRARSRPVATHRSISSCDRPEGRCHPAKLRRRSVDAWVQPHRSPPLGR